MLQRQLENRAKHNIGVCEHLLSPLKICIKIVFIQYVFIIFSPLPMPHRFSQPPLLPNFMFSLSLPKKEKRKTKKKNGNQNKLKIIIRKIQKQAKSVQKKLESDLTKHALSDLTKHALI